MNGPVLKTGDRNADTPENKAFSEDGARNCLLNCSAGALNDPDLGALSRAWPKLPAAIRAGIVAMVRAAAESGGAQGR